MDIILETKGARTLLSYLSKGLKDIGSDTFSASQVWGEIIHDSLFDFNLPRGKDALRALEGHRNTLRQANSMLHVLNGLTDALKNRTFALDSILTSAAYGHGLDRLPDEILAIILGLVEDDFGQVVNLSSVCKRFRSVMVASPQLWANCKLHTDMTCKQIKSVLKLSRDLPLTCVLYRDGIGSRNSVYGVEDRFGWHSDLETPMDTILAQTSRIGALQLPAMIPEQVLILQRKLGNAELPALHSLSLNAFLPLFPFEDIVHFYETCRMPALRYLKSSDHIPQQVLGANLIRCDLELYSFDIIALRRLLSSSPHLQTLVVSLFDVGRFGLAPTDVEEISSSPVVVPNLHILNVSASGHTSPDIFERIAQNFSFPSVTESTFQLVYLENNTEEEAEDNVVRLNSLIEWLLPSVPSLRNLTLDLSGPTRSSFCLNFAFVLNYVPKELETICVIAPSHDIDMLWEERSDDYVAPELRCLRFSDCDMMFVSFMESLREDLFQDGVEVPRVEVVRCAHIKEDTLKAAFPKSEIYYEP